MRLLFGRHVSETPRTARHRRHRVLKQVDALHVTLQETWPSFQKLRQQPILIFYVKEIIETQRRSNYCCELNKK